MFLSFNAKLILVSLFLIILTFSSKINISSIICHHLQTFKFYKGDVKEYKNSNPSKIELIFFFFIPIILSILLNLEFLINSENVGLIITIFSIFTGLLFNLLILIYDIMNKEKEYSDEKKLFISEIYFNISFSILMSIMIICLSIIISFNIKSLHIKFLSSLLVLYFIIVFILTILMILKRIHTLLFNEFNN